MNDTVHTPDPLFVQAAAKVAAQLGVDAKDVTISRDPHIKPEHRHHYATAVLGSSDTAPNTREAVDLYVTVRKRGIDVNELEEKQHIRDKLQTKPFTSVAQIAPAENVVMETRKKIESAIEGTTFNRELLKSPIFDPVLTKEHQVNAHLLNFTDSTAYGIEGSVRIPARAGQDISAKLKEVSEYLKGAEFRASVTDRVEKYVEENAKKEGKSPDEVTAAKKLAREQCADLKIDTNTHTEGNLVRWSIRSIRQDEELKKNNNKTYPEPSNADELRAKNPLHLLSTKAIPATETSPKIEPQLNKAIGRALQKLPHYIEVAGAVDIRNLIGKEMARVFTNELKDKPEKQELLKQVAKSPIFLEHSNRWENGPTEVGEALPEPTFTRVSPDTLEIKLTLTRVPHKKDPIKSLLDDIIAEPLGQHNPQQHTPAPTHAAAPHAPVPHAPAPHAAPAAAHAPAAQDAPSEAQVADAAIKSVLAHYKRPPITPTSIAPDAISTGSGMAIGKA